MIIYKYSILKNPVDVLEIPGLVHILSAGVQDNDIVLWAKVDPSITEKVSMEVAVIPTGMHFEDKGYHFIQTVFMDWMVFHIFVKEV